MIESLETRRLLSFDDLGSFVDFGVADLSSKGTLAVVANYADNSITVARVAGLETLADRLLDNPGSRGVEDRPGVYVGYFALGRNEDIQAFDTPRKTDRAALIDALRNNFGDAPVVLAISKGSLPAIMPAAEVKRVLVDASHGDDRVTIAKNIELPTTLFGGTGNDTLIGGAGRDLIEGGRGNDRIIARGRGATVYGGLGDDTIFGSARARDSLSGGAGRDRAASIEDDTVEGIESAMD